MTTTDRVSAALRAVIEEDARSVLTPPIAVLQRRAHRRRRGSAVASAMALIVVVAGTGAAVHTVRDYGPTAAGQAAAGPGATATVEVREVLEAIVPPAGAPPVKTAIAYSPEELQRGCEHPTPVPDDAVAAPVGEVLACLAGGTELLHLAAAGVSDADVTDASANGPVVTLSTSPDGTERAMSLLRATHSKRVAFLVNGVVVAAPTLYAPPGLTVQLDSDTEAENIAAAIRAAR